MVLVGLFEGGLDAVATRYRRWAAEQPWAAEPANRAARGGSSTQDSGSGIAVLQTACCPGAAMQDYPACRSACSGTGGTAAYDVNFPEYLPPRSRTDACAVRQAHSTG